MKTVEIALGSMEDIGGNDDKQKEEFVVADVVDIIVNVGKVKVDEVEGTGADRRESRRWLRLGYASVEGRRIRSFRREMSWFEEEENV